MLLMGKKSYSFIKSAGTVMLLIYILGLRALVFIYFLLCNRGQKTFVSSNPADVIAIQGLELKMAKLQCDPVLLFVTFRPRKRKAR